MNGNEPYNPVMHSDGTFKGVSIRENFAALAMQGIVSNAQMIDTANWDWLAKASVAAADALIAELNKTQP